MRRFSKPQPPPPSTTARMWSACQRVRRMRTTGRLAAISIALSKPSASVRASSRSAGGNGDAGGFGGAVAAPWSRAHSGRTRPDRARTRALSRRSATSGPEEIRRRLRSRTPAGARARRRRTRDREVCRPRLAAGADRTPGEISRSARSRPQRPRSLKPGWSSGRRPSGQRYFRSDSWMGRSLMLAKRRRINPSASNSQFSFPYERYQCPESSCHS